MARDQIADDEFTSIYDRRRNAPSQEAANLEPLAQACIQNTHCYVILL